MKIMGREKNKPITKEWSIKLRVSLEEEQKIKMGAIKMSMGIAKYIKQAALEKTQTQSSKLKKKLS